MTLAGIASPLDLPCMHQILDVVEMIVIEGYGSRSDIQKYYFRTYKPDPRELTSTAFTPEESLASFDALSSALGNLH